MQPDQRRPLRLRYHRHIVPLTFTISELCQRSGVPLPTVKFYLREGLLPPGDTDRPRRAYYDERHLRRLSLIRSLQQVAGLPLSTIRGLVEAIERSSGDVVGQIAPTIDALMPDPGDPETPELRRALAVVDEAILSWGLEVRPHAAARRQLARSLLAFCDAMGKDLTADVVTPYLEALRPITRVEVEVNAATLEQGGDRAVELSLLGTVLCEQAIVALRRLLHEHWTTTLHPDRKVKATRARAPAARGGKTGPSRR